MAEHSSTEWIQAPEGCPRFGLRGDDPEAPSTILHWAQARRMRLLAAIPPDGTLTKEIREELAQCTAAETIAWEMQAYQQKIDMSGKGASYHIAKLSEALKIIREAGIFANDNEVAKRPIAETLARAVDTIERLANCIKEH